MSKPKKCAKFGRNRNYKNKVVCRKHKKARKSKR